MVVAPKEIDVASAREFAERLDAAFATGIAVVVADLGRTTFCDSSGLKVLVQAARKAQASGQRLVVHEPPRVLRRMIGILGAASLLDLPADEPSPTSPAESSEQGRRS